MRYTATAQAIGTRSKAQRHDDETYMDTRSEMFTGCTKAVYIIENL